jgi:hypothetical protein
MTRRAVNSLGSGKVSLVRSRTLWLRVVLGVFVLLNCRVFAIMIRTELSGLRSPTYQDAQTATELAFAPVLPYLPMGGPVGYLKPGFDRANAADLEELYRAQYALAPRILVTGTPSEFVIAIAREGVGLPEVPEGFARQRVFGPTLALYRRVK